MDGTVLELVEWRNASRKKPNSTWRSPFHSNGSEKKKPWKLSDGSAI